MRALPKASEQERAQLLGAIFDASAVLEIETAPTALVAQFVTIEQAARLLASSPLPAAVWRRYAALVGDDPLRELAHMRRHMHVLAQAAYEANEALAVQGNRPKDVVMLQFLAQLATGWHRTFGEWPTPTGPFARLCKEIAEPLGIEWPKYAYSRLRRAIEHAKSLR